MTRRTLNQRNLTKAVKTLSDQGLSVTHVTLDTDGAIGIHVGVANIKGIFAVPNPWKEKANAERAALSKKL